MKAFLSVAALAAVASSFAGTYTTNTGNLMMSGTAATTVSSGMSGMTGVVRGVAVSAGNWSTVTDAGQWSSEFGFALTAPDGSTYARRASGQGTSTGSAYTFTAPVGSTTWNNATPAYDVFGSTATAGTYSIAYNQSYGATGVTQNMSTSLTFYTDAMAPVSTGTLSDSSPTFNRPTSLTATASGTATGTGVSYTSKSFSIGTAGTYLVGGQYTGLSTATSGLGGWDGYMFLYNGAFDPSNPLTNLIGLDDDGSVLAGTSSMLMSLSAGTYTAVFSEYQATTLGTGVSGSTMLFVAGGVNAVPEPASFAALGLGALALLRRRRK